LNTRFVLITGLVFSVILSSWLLYQHDMITGRPAISSHGPDLFVDNMDLKLINADGKLHYHITADRLDHYPYDDRAELTRPVMHVFTANRPTWQIQSDSGRISSGEETVWLLGAVEVRRLATPATRPLAIFTRDLLVKPDAQTAETVNMARIQSDRFEVESTGLHADFRNNRLELKSRVRGRFDAAG
jgi:lipopolysaccharide export system protein LptC